MNETRKRYLEEDISYNQLREPRFCITCFLAHSPTSDASPAKALQTSRRFISESHNETFTSTDNDIRQRLSMQKPQSENVSASNACHRRSEVCGLLGAWQITMSLRGAGKSFSTASRRAKEAVIRASRLAGKDTMLSRRITPTICAKPSLSQAKDS
jgi:hypothetical protein